MAKNGTVKHKPNHGGQRLKPWWWQPGQSGNPNGRPKSPLTLTEMHRNGMGKPIPKRVQETLGNLVWGRDGEITPDIAKLKSAWMRTTVTWGEAITARNLYRAMSPQGDQIIKIIWEMLDGKALQRLADQEGKPLKLSAIDPQKYTTEELYAFQRLLIKGAVQGETDNEE